MLTVFPDFSAEVNSHPALDTQCPLTLMQLVWMDGIGILEFSLDSNL